MNGSVYYLHSGSFLECQAMATKTKTLRRGRPVDQGRIDLILDAARAEFLEAGFAGFAIESVAARAGVSKVTVYKHFSTRDVLIGAFIGRESSWMEAEAMLAKDNRPLNEATLVAYGTHLMQFLARPDVVALDARMHQAPAIFRPIVARYFAEGPARLMTALTTLMTAAITSKLIAGEPEEAATTLLGLWLTAIPLPTRLGLAPLPQTKAIHAHVTKATARFLRAFGTGHG
jgi:TetR/AcrR family transcriptional regulator, mexJK operon transcriptional repressor